MYATKGKIDALFYRNKLMAKSHTWSAIESACVKSLWNAPRIRQNDQEMSKVGKSVFKQKDLVCQIFLLAQTVSYHYSLIFCLFCLIFNAFEIDHMCEDSVHFNHDIWSLIHFYRKVGQFFLLVE